MGRSKKKWDLDDIPDLTGKTAVVTGANSGIGFEAAKSIAGNGAQVVMACRDPGRAQDALDAIEREHPDAQVSLGQLDLADLSSVRSFADDLELDRIDLLINNAGVMAPPDRRETADGFELQLGTNHLGHFALTGLLLDRMLEVEGSRVVTVSSQAHRNGKIDFDDLQCERSYTPFSSYGQSKLANLLFTYELQRKLEAADAATIATAAHPGWTATNLQRFSKIFSALNPLLAQKIEMGALPTLRAATDPGAEGGDYYGPGGLFEIRGHPVKVDSTSRSKDRAVAARLWAVSRELTEVKYPI